MHEATYWAGFLGAWLLFAGPLYQSALELREEDQARDSMQKALAASSPPKQVSRWWWLLPPVAIVMVFRRRGEYVRLIDAPMTDSDRDAIEHYKAVARGWWFVGAGAWFIFLKETFELVEHHEWGTAVYWTVVVLMSMVALGGAGAGGDRGARERNRGRRQGETVTTNPGDEPTPAASS